MVYKIFLKKSFSKLILLAILGTIIIFPHKISAQVLGTGVLPTTEVNPAVIGGVTAAGAGATKKTTFDLVDLAKRGAGQAFKNCRCGYRCREINYREDSLHRDRGDGERHEGRIGDRGCEH